MNSEVKQQIDNLINNHAVVLFMKGTKEQPQCGFSKRVVEVLKQLSSDFVTVDVLADPMIREGIKVYSSWPTIPQLYIKGEFIGGCDIVLDMSNKRQLEPLLGFERALVKPHITMSNAAINAFMDANVQRGDDESFRLSINNSFEHSLSFDQAHESDFRLSFGEVEIVIDPYSAARAHGLSVDFITEELESGFAFTNPNEPPPVKELSVHELQQWLTSNTPSLLLDVRPRSEWQKAHIISASLLEEMSEDALNAIAKNHPIILFCHHGGRSMRAAESFRKKGFTNLYNLTGGIDAWARQIDRNVPTY